MQLGRTDPFCILLHDPTFIFVVKAFGSVRHEGPYYRLAAEWRDLPGVLHRGSHVVAMRTIEQCVLTLQGTSAF